MKIPEDELDVYMKKKINEDDKLKILFGVEAQEEIKDTEDKKDKSMNTLSDKKSPAQTIDNKEKETISNQNISTKKEKTEKEEEEEDDDWNFEPRIRENKQTNETNSQFEYIKLNEYKKTMELYNK